MRRLRRPEASVVFVVVRRPSVRVVILAVIIVDLRREVPHEARGEDEVRVREGVGCV